MRLHNCCLFVCVCVRKIEGECTCKRECVCGSVSKCVETVCVVCVCVLVRAYSRRRERASSPDRTRAAVPCSQCAAGPTAITRPLACSNAICSYMHREIFVNRVLEDNIFAIMCPLWRDPQHSYESLLAMHLFHVLVSHIYFSQHV